MSYEVLLSHHHYIGASQHRPLQCAYQHMQTPKLVQTLHAHAHNHVLRLSRVKGSNTREDKTLKELEGSATTSGDVGHLLSEAGLLNGSDGVTSTDDGDGALASALSEGLGDSVGALSELVELEHTHGAVPDDGLAVRELLLDELGGLGAVVKTHPSVGDSLDAGDLKTHAKIPLDNSFGSSCKITENDNISSTNYSQDTAQHDSTLVTLVLASAANLSARMTSVGRMSFTLIVRTAKVREHIT
jgi:hypothetical protein